jgi:hypothetical protein
MPARLRLLPENILDDIGVASPCSADWNAMRGDERVRHCPACRLNVYNLSAMSRREAARLVVEREGRLCVRLLRRDDGTLVTDDCRERLRAARRRGRIAFICALVLVCLFQLGLRLAVVRSLIASLAGEPPFVAHTGAMPIPAPIMGKPAPIMMGEMAPQPLPPTPHKNPPAHKMGKMVRRATESVY